MILIKQKGVGLIEVLIATVVIALGLLAVASMQGTFLSSSGESKTRAEALVIAERQMESLRNMIQNADFDTLPTPTSPVNGVNASFTVGQVVAAASSPDRKQITLTVSWDGGGADKQIVLTSEIAFSNPANAIALAAFGDASVGSSGKAPSPGNRASESVEDNSIDLFDSKGSPLSKVVSIEDDLYTLDGNTYRDDKNGKTGSRVILCSTLTAFDKDLSFPGNYDEAKKPKYNEATGTFTNDANCAISGTTGSACLYTNRRIVDGTETIELYTQHYTSSTTGLTTTYTLFDACIAEHRFFGGIIIPIKGKVRTEFTLDDIKIDHNKENMFCAFYPGSELNEQPYACYVGGNCENDTGSENPNATSCSLTASTARRDVGSGGFSGNIGLINGDDNGSGKESVCFKDELDGTNTAFFTARKYKTINSSIEEGINEPYACQDFYIVGRQANVSRLSAKCAAETWDGTSNINLPPQEVIRTIDSANTVVTTENIAYCTRRTPITYDLTIAVTGGTPTTVVTGNGDTLTCSSDGVCKGKTTTSAITIIIYASNNTQSGSCLISNLSSADTSRSCDSSTDPVVYDKGSIILLSPPKYTLNGLIKPILNSTGGYSMKVTADSFIGTPSCSFTTNTFSCTISTLESSVRMEIKKGKASDSCNANNLTAAPSSSLTIDKVCVLNP
ncbi:MAG: hypothetical protein IBX55_08230 [Methyloprofundus sp.]|nr:hypothetical protein [Methyloprofundus sp.]MBW6453348.1 hypothetical protein [Methyloprofundus sp.]